MNFLRGFDKFFTGILVLMALLFIGLVISLVALFTKPKQTPVVINPTTIVDTTQYKDSIIVIKVKK